MHLELKTFYRAKILKVDSLFTLYIQKSSKGEKVDTLLAESTHSGTLILGKDGAKVKCFVLKDGRRVISGRGLTEAIGMKGRSVGAKRIIGMSHITKHIPEDSIELIEEPIKFTGRGTLKNKHGYTTGYEATVLLDLCEAILDARNNGELKSEQEHRYADYCEALVRSFAKVGIVALVDEATGYQKDRARDELHKILEAYIAKELLPWSKRFPDEFYKELFRLRGWKLEPMSVKRPKIVGKLTNQLIYNQLPKGVLKALQEANPINESGNRKDRHHQHLSKGIGDSHLEKQVASVTMLMRISSNWPSFMRNFNRAFGIQEPLFEETEIIR